MSNTWPDGQGYRYEIAAPEQGQSVYFPPPGPRKLGEVGAGMTEKGDALTTGEPGAHGGADEHSSNGASPELNGDLPLQDTEELRALISQGRERGYLTFEEIAGTLE